MKIQIVNHQ